MKKYYPIVLIGAAILIVVIGLIGINKKQELTAGANLVDNRTTDSGGRVVIIDAFVSTTTAATSTSISIAGAKKITAIFARSAHSSGLSKFAVEVSAIFNRDTAGAETGTQVDNEFLVFRKLIDNVDNSNSQQLTRVDSISLTANGTTTVSLDLTHDTYSRIRCTAERLADGTNNCQFIIEY